MTDLPDRLRAIADTLDGDEWEHPLCAEDDCRRAADEIERLQAIVDKLRDYDHHNTQACCDEDDGAIDPAFYDDAEDESRLATKCLVEAVLMSRGVSPEEAAEAAGGEDNG